MTILWHALAFTVFAFLFLLGIAGAVQADIDGRRFTQVLMLLVALFAAWCTWTLVFG